MRTESQVKEALKIKLMEGSISPEEAKAKLIKFRDMSAVQQPAEQTQIQPPEAQLQAQQPEAQLQVQEPQMQSALVGQPPQQEQPTQMEEWNTNLLGPKPEETSYPSEINGVPTLPKDVIFAYKTRALPYKSRIRVEKALKYGEYALPPNVNMPLASDEESSRSLSERISETLSGTKRSGGLAGNLPNYLAMPEMSSGEGAMLKGLISSTASPEERVQIAEASGIPVERDFYNNPILISPTDGKKYTIGPGVSPADVLGAVALTVPSIMTAGTAPAIASTLGKREIIKQGLKFAGKESVKEGLIQTAAETAQAAEGGSFDVSDIALATGTTGAFELVSPIARATKISNIEKVMKLANDGSPEAEQTLAKMYNKNPKAVDAIAESLGISYRPDTGFGLVDNLESAMKSVAKDPKTASNLAKLLDSNQGLVKVLKDNDLYDSVAISAIIDQKSPTTKKFIDSISSEGVEGIEAQAHSLVNDMSEKVIKKMEDIGATQDLSKVTKEVSDIMFFKKNALEKKATSIYDGLLESIPENASASANKTIEYLEKTIKARQRFLPEGFELTGPKEDPTSYLSPFQKKVYNNLKTRTASKTDKSFDVYGFEKAQSTDYIDVPASYHELDALRREAGDKMNPNILVADPEQGAAKKLYSLMSQDQEIAIKALGDPELAKKWGIGKRLVTARKAVEDDLTVLFGKQFDKEFISGLESSTRELSKKGTGKFIKMLNAVPKSQRERFTASAMLHAMGSKLDNLDTDRFAQWWSTFKKSSEGMSLIKNNLPDGGMEVVDGIGNAFIAMAKAKDKVKNADAKWVKEIIDPKKNLMEKILSGFGQYASSSLIVTGLSSVMGGLSTKLGTVGLGLGVLGAIRAGFKGAKKEEFDAFVDLVSSKEFKDLLASGDNAPIFIKTLSRSEKMKRFAKMVKVDDSEDKITKWIMTAMRPSKMVDSEEDK